MLHRMIAALTLALALTFGSAEPVLGQSAQATAPTPAHLQLDAPDGRRIDLSVWQAVGEQGVVVFSHGFNSNPERYDRLIAEWAGRGFTVVAPLHVDSLQHPDHEGSTNEQAFVTRIMDLAVTRGFVQATRGDKPVVAAGHSFGSLMSLISAGAVTVAGPQGDPAVKAVVAFSSAGDVAGVVDPRTYDALGAPVLMITGDADVVPDRAPDWRAHRSAFDRAPDGDNMLMVFQGGDHSLVGNADDADFALIVEATTDFMRAHALGDEAAATRLDTLVAPDGVTLERR